MSGTRSREKPRIINSTRCLAPAHAAPILIRPSTRRRPRRRHRDLRLARAHGTGTFEIEPPDRREMARRRADVLAKGLPWLVLEDGGEVVGYAYANQFRPRPAYRFCLEDSVYLARRQRRPRLRPPAPGRVAGALRGRRRAPDARRDRRLGQRRLDRRAPRARLRASRHDRARPAGSSTAGSTSSSCSAASAPARGAAPVTRRERRPRRPLEDASRPGSPSSAAASACIASTCTARATRWAWLHPLADAGRRLRRLAHARSSASTTALGSAARAVARPHAARRRCCRRSSTA